MRYSISREELIVAIALCAYAIWDHFHKATS